MNDLDDLISGHFDRGLNAEQRVELERRLVAEPAAARRFAAYARLHANLHQQARDESAHREPEFDSPIPPPLAGPGARRVLAPIAAIAAVLLVAIGGALWLGRQDAPAFGEIASAEGELLIDGNPIAGGARFADGATLSTGAQASATLRLRDGSEVVLDRDTRLGVGRQDGEWRLRLDRGEVECVVARQAPGEGFVLRTAEATVAVVGTRFLVEHRDGRSAVRVTEGEVTLAAGGELLRMGPSDRAIVSAGVVTTDIPSEAVFGGDAPLYREDFEQPIDPARWTVGHRIASADGPAGNRSAWVVAAQTVTSKTGGQLLQVVVRDLDQPLFTVEEDLVVRVRYWANREAGWLGVWMATEPWNAYQHYHKEFTPITDRWVTTSIRLRDILRERSQQGPAPGDRVVHLMFQCDGREGARLFIDDVSIERIALDQR